MALVWNTTTSYPTDIHHAAVVANDKCVYVAGGLTSNLNASITSNVYRANINPDGSLSSWVAESSLTNPRMGAQGVYVGGSYTSGGTFWAMGGSSPDVSTFVSSAERGNTSVFDGDLNGWYVPARNFVLNRNTYFIAAAEDQSRPGIVFFAGGDVDNVGAVFYNKCNYDGTTDGIVQVTTLVSPTVNNLSYGLVAYNGRLYQLTGDTVTKRYATISGAPSSPSLSSWQSTTSMGYTTPYCFAFAHNNRAYVVGDNGTYDYRNVVSASIASDGSIGSWTDDSLLPAHTEYVNGARNSKYVYIVGGHNGTNPKNTVYYAELPKTLGYTGAFTGFNSGFNF